MAQDLGGQPQRTARQRSRALLSALLPIHSEQLGLPIVVQLCKKMANYGLSI